MKTLILIFCLLISHEIYSQTFKISNIGAEGFTAEKSQQIKQKGLGAKVEMKFYDESVKVIIYRLNGRKETEFILDKIKHLKNEYFWENSMHTERIILTINTLASYITSAILTREREGIIPIFPTNSKKL